MSLTFSQKILVGLTLGILTGVFLGERALALEWAAEGFVKLLQMTVLPYVTVSIVESLGSLCWPKPGVSAIAPAPCSSRCGWSGWPSPSSFRSPSRTCRRRRSSARRCSNSATTSTSSTSTSRRTRSIRWRTTSCRRSCCSQSFSACAVIGTDRKPVLLDVLRVARVALSRATRFIVQLTPYGLFAIAAVAAGTLSLDQIGRLQVFLVAYVGVSLLVALWVLPGLVAAVTPIRARDIFALTRDALITAFVAGDLFIVLPVLIESSRTLVERAGAGGRGSRSCRTSSSRRPSTSHTPASCSPSASSCSPAGSPTPPVPVLAYPRLALTGLVTFFGSMNSAVPFLLDLFHVPADTFQLFLASSVINSRVRHAGRGDAHAGGGAAQHLRDDRADALRAPRASCATS